MKIRRCKGQVLRRRASPQKTESAAGVKFDIVETFGVHRSSSEFGVVGTRSRAIRRRMDRRFFLADSKYALLRFRIRFPLA
jgi:hypothetical protein